MIFWKQLLRVIRSLPSITPGIFPRVDSEAETSPDARERRQKTGTGGVREIFLNGKRVRIR